MSGPNDDPTLSYWAPALAGAPAPAPALPPQVAGYYGVPNVADTLGAAPAPPPAGAPAPAGIDPSWLQGATPPPAATTLPPVEQVKPGAMFGQAPPPGPAPGTPQPSSAGGAPSIANLRATSTQMNAEAAGAPPKPAASPEQDRAAKALAYYGGAGGKPGPAKSGGSGGPGNPDPYGVKAARKGLYGTYDAEEAAMERGGQNEMNRADALAAGQSMLADRQQQEAERQAVEAAHAADIFKQHMNESERQLEDIRTQKVDPNRLYADTGSKVLAVLGGVLGGLYQGLNKMEKNPFIEDMNRAIQQDIGLQERELSRQTNAVEHRQNALSQMRAVYKDEGVAKLQAMNLMYEGAKQKLAAEAASYDSPAIFAKTQQAIQQLDRQQKQLKLGDAMQQAAAAQAAAAAQHAREKEAMEFALKVEEAKTHRIAAEKSGEGKEPPLRSRFVATGKDPKTGEPTGYLERDASTAKERETSLGAAQKLLKQIDRVQEIRKEQGFVGRVGSKAVGLYYDTKAANELAVLESDMTTTAAQAAHLGALSDSDRGLLTSKFRNLNSPGSGPDERLDELRRITQAGLAAETEAAGGARAVKHADETVEAIGGSNAPHNPRAGSSVRREAP